MPRPRTFVVALVLTVLVMLGASAPALSTTGSVEDFVERSFEASNVPGMAVVVTRGDEVVLARGYGVDGRGEPMTTSTPLRVASMTKTVTSVAVHQLADDGLIDLGDPVVEHLPEFRLDDPRHRSITVQHLLDNRSGMRDSLFDLGRLNRSGSLREYVAGLAGAGLSTDPGAAQAYCNVNWEVLARMVEVVTGRPYARHLEERVFAPLGMADSTVDIAAVDPPGGYQELFGFHAPRADRVLFAASSGSNGLVTTADDLARWTRWVASGAGAPILAPGTRERLLERAAREGSTDGFEGRGERIGKNGMQHTESSQLRLVPALGLGATVVVNDGDPAGPALAAADGALDALQGRPVEPVGSGWRLVTAAYVAVGLTGVAAGLLGVRRARRWARRRRGGRPWVTVLRAAWLALPAATLAALPTLVSALTMGRRTILWEQAGYLLLTPLVVLALLSVAGGAVLVARLVAWRSELRHHGARGEQFAGGEAEDRPDRVAEVRR